MSVKIVIDSTTDVSSTLRGRVNVVPLTLHFGEEEFIDGVTITNEEFYAKLIESDALPQTSQATPVVFGDVFEEIVKNGDTAVVIALASKLSGTCQSAMLAAQEYPGKIFVVDSTSAAIGATILAEYALRLADSGMEAEAIARELEEKKSKVVLVALLDTLEYLKKGGRISAAAAFAGGLLSIKPVISIEDGEIKVLGKARGSKQGNNLLLQEIAKAGGVDYDMPALLGYSGLSDLLLKKYIEDSAALWKGKIEEPESLLIGSVIGTHAGPGAIAVAFFKP